jgi:hypothetical protein
VGLFSCRLIESPGSIKKVLFAIRTSARENEPTNNPNRKGFKMIIVSKTRPSLKTFGVAEGANAKVVSLGGCRWGIVAKRGGAGTMRQNPRQSSGKLMRCGKYGRKTIQIKGRLVARIMRTQDPEFRSFVEKHHEETDETVRLKNLQDLLAEFW